MELLCSIHSDVRLSLIHISGHDHPALGGVYKLSANIVDGEMIPKLKISENVWKITNPGIKKIKRIYSKADGMAIADLIMLESEEIDANLPLTIFDPIETWKKMTIVAVSYTHLATIVFLLDVNCFRMFAAFLIYSSP